MPISVGTPTGPLEDGAGVGGGSATGLPNATASILLGPKQNTGQEATGIVLNIAATGTFRLNYLFSNDGGTSWLVGHQESSTTVTVDGGTASYTESAAVDISVGYHYKLEIYNTSGGNIDYKYEVREYAIQ